MVSRNLLRSRARSISNIVSPRVKLEASSDAPSGGTHRQCASYHPWLGLNEHSAANHPRWSTPLPHQIRCEGGRANERHNSLVSSARIWCRAVSTTTTRKEGEKMYLECECRRLHPYPALQVEVGCRRCVFAQAWHRLPSKFDLNRSVGMVLGVRHHAYDFHL